MSVSQIIKSGNMFITKQISLWQKQNEKRKKKKDKKSIKVKKGFFLKQPPFFK